jgi:hypothetical protein
MVLVEFVPYPYKRMGKMMMKEMMEDDDEVDHPRFIFFFIIIVLILSLVGTGEQTPLAPKLWI